MMCDWNWQFLDNKKLRPSDCDKPTHYGEPPQSAFVKSHWTRDNSGHLSESLFPINCIWRLKRLRQWSYNQKKIRMDEPKVRYLKVIVEQNHRQNIGSNRSSLSDISLCENDQPSEGPVHMLSWLWRDSYINLSSVPWFWLQYWSDIIRDANRHQFYYGSQWGMYKLWQNRRMQCNCRLNWRRCCLSDNPKLYFTLNLNLALVQ